MATSSRRRLDPTEVRRFGTGKSYLSPPDLTQIQTVSYANFLQAEYEPDQRNPEVGIESVLQEIFPIMSYDGQTALEFVRYELGRPRYTPEECKQLRMTYGRPFRIWLRLKTEEPREEEVYLGDMPVMLGGGEFIINGAERVVVSQLHRSPGVDFVMESCLCANINVWGDVSHGHTCANVLVGVDADQRAPHGQSRDPGDAEVGYSELGGC